MPPTPRVRGAAALLAERRTAHGVLVQRDRGAWLRVRLPPRFESDRAQAADFRGDVVDDGARVERASSTIGRMSADGACTTVSADLTARARGCESPSAISPSPTQMSPAATSETSAPSGPVDRVAFTTFQQH